MNWHPPLGTAGLCAFHSTILTRAVGTAIASLLLVVLSMSLSTPAAWPAESLSEQRSFNPAEVDVAELASAPVDMDTCLAVADDGNALEFWNSSPFRHVGTEPGRGLTDDLDEMPLFWRHEFGFSTIYACAEIIDAWYAPPQQTYAFSGDDGRLLHGTIVIDLATDKAKSGGNSDNSGQYGLIDALALVRILNAPFLLPQSSFGGIVIRHARIEGSLLFHNLQLGVPLAFVDVEFRGNDYSKVVFGQKKPIEDAALTIAFSDFGASLLIARSGVCGNIRIVDSRFSESVTLDEVEQKSLDCRPLSDFEDLEAAPPILRISSSSFAQSLELMRSAFGQASISGSDINKLSSEKSHFGKSAEITENDIERLQISCSMLAEETRVARNRIDKQLLVEGTDIVLVHGEPDKACNDWWQNDERRRSATAARLTIDDNRIGGGLFLRSFAGSALKPDVRLVSNRVSSGSEIILPRPDASGQAWRGNVDLQGSIYDATLTITEARKLIRDQPAEQVPFAFCEKLGRNNRPKGITVEFRAAHVRTLRWDLPLTCDYRWLGYGLTYDLWMKGGLAKASLGMEAEGKDPAELDHLAFSFWRQTLRRYDSSSLTTMSQYLTEKGQYVASRGILYEAKRLNYAPDCKPDDQVWKCLWQMVAGPSSSSGALAAEPDGQAAAEVSNPTDDIGTWNAFTAWLEDASAWLTRFAMLILLWPGGYGASPEWAIVLLVLLFGACWFIYQRYTATMRKQLVEEWSDIRHFLDKNQDLIARLKLTEASKPGLDDSQAWFDFEEGTAAGADTRWIDRTTWVDEMTDEDRLLEIQGPLLAKVKVWESGSSGLGLKTVQDFRQRLARFGNTEIPGFDRFDGDKMPKRFTERLYAFDTMLPVVDLHAYSNYYPIAGWARMLSVLQHVCGWWWVTVFIASAAIL